LLTCLGKGVIRFDKTNRGLTVSTPYYVYCIFYNVKGLIIARVKFADMFWKSDSWVGVFKFNKPTGDQVCQLPTMNTVIFALLKVKARSSQE
jgi:hypothetical protein